jgi:hypothetical protein
MNGELNGSRIVGEEQELTFAALDYPAYSVRAWYQYEGEGDTWHEVKLENPNSCWRIPITPTLAEYKNSPEKTKANPTIWTWVNFYNKSGKKLGQNKDWWKLKLPESEMPVITDLILKSNSQDEAIFVANYSTITVDVKGTAQAPIERYHATLFDSKGNKLNSYVQLTSSTEIRFAFQKIAVSGKARVEVYVKDQRGLLSRPFSKTIDVLEYTPSGFEGVTINRCDDRGNLVESGTYGMVTVNYNAFTPGTTKAKIVVSYREYGTSTWKTGTSVEVKGKGTRVIRINGNFDTVKNYQIRVQLIDNFDGVEHIGMLPTELTVFEIYKTGKGITFGGVAEREGLNSFFPVRIYNERSFNPTYIYGDLEEALMKFGAELNLADGVQESLQEWVMLVNQCIIKLANNYESPLELRRPMISLKWNDTFVPEKDGFCMIAVDPSSSDCRAKITNTDSNAVIYDSGTRGNASAFRHWFPVTGGYTYRLEGQSAKTVYISYQYLRK